MKTPIPKMAMLLLAAALAAVSAHGAPLRVEDFDFSAPFGNVGSKVEKKGENHFLLMLGAQPKHPEWPNLIQFSIQHNARGNPLKLDITFTPQGKNDTKEENIGAGNYRFFGNGRYFWSYDRKTWKEINLQVPQGKDSRVCTMEFPPFEQDQVYVSTQNPLAHEDILALREELKDNPLVKVHVVGQSIQGREILRFEVADPQSDVPLKQRWAHYTSNQHPGEANARWRIMGMLRWALSDAARDFRRFNVGHFVFSIAPDGIANGWWRTDADGVDMNRCCRVEGADEKLETREAFIAHKDIENLMASETPLTTLWSQHTAPGAVYMGIIQGPEQKGQAFIEALKRLAPTPDFFGSLTIQKGGAGDRWNGCIARQFGITATLVEGGQGLSRELCHATGEAVIRAIAECYKAPRGEMNPNHDGLKH